MKPSSQPQFPAELEGSSRGVNSHPELPPGSSLVTIRLTDEPEGTRLEFRHDLPEEKLRDHHVPGWRYHLAVFANVVADERHHAAADVIDAWFRAWAETGIARRKITWSSSITPTGPSPGLSNASSMCVCALVASMAE
jgi:hypothetical protein